MWKEVRKASYELFAAQSKSQFVLLVNLAIHRESGPKTVMMRLQEPPKLPTLVLPALQSAQFLASVES
jgi:hypothetical protein